MLQKRQCLTAVDNKSAHVGYIEQTGLLAGGQMLLHDTRFILNRHVPSAEFNHFGPQGHMPVMKNGLDQWVHGIFPLVPSHSFFVPVSSMQRSAQGRIGDLGHDFAQGGVGVDGFGEVLCCAAHAQGKGGLGDKISNMGPHHVYPEDGP